MTDPTDVGCYTAGKASKRLSRGGEVGIAGNCSRQRWSAGVVAEGRSKPGADGAGGRRPGLLAQKGRWGRCEGRDFGVGVGAVQGGVEAARATGGQVCCRFGSQGWEWRGSGKGGRHRGAAACSRDSTLKDEIREGRGTMRGAPSSCRSRKVGQHLRPRNGRGAVQGGGQPGAVLCQELNGAGARG